MRVTIFWNNRADSYGKLGQWSKTIEDCSKAINAKADFELAWFRWAMRVAGPFGCRCQTIPPCSVSTSRSSNRTCACKFFSPVPLAQGTLLEIGVGPGVNFVYYDPARVSKLYAPEPNPAMVRLAEKHRRFTSWTWSFWTSGGGGKNR